MTNGDFKEAFRRLQHSCIRHFDLEILDSAFMRYWKTQENEFVVERISRPWRLDGTDYEALDSAVSHLCPKSYRIHLGPSSWSVDGRNRDIDLLARDSFLSSLEMCYLNVSQLRHYME